MKKSTKCPDCGRKCAYDQKWRHYYHSYYLDELLSGKVICKKTTFDTEASSLEKSLSDARLKQANEAWDEVGV